MKDKATEALITGIEDGMNKDFYDEEFYQAMYRVRPLGAMEINPWIRRAIMRFISDGMGEASKIENGGFVMMGFIHGYELGRRLRKDIRKDAGDNPRTIKQDVQNAGKQMRKLL